MMHPNPKNPPNLNFKFPENRLLPLRGTVGLDELHKPTTYDEHGNRCLLVLKNGKSTGLTVGRANSLMSITRQLSPCGTKYLTAHQWAIFPYDDDSGPFAAEGDSGAAVVDGAGRIAGIINSANGAGVWHGMGHGLTYVTPIDAVMKVIKDHEPLKEVYVKPA